MAYTEVPRRVFSIVGMAYTEVLRYIPRNSGIGYSEIVVYFEVLVLANYTGYTGSMQALLCTKYLVRLEYSTTVFVHAKYAAISML